MNIPIVDPDAPVQSPFLPGTQIQFAWDSTSLGLFKTCPRLYQYVMLEGWTGKDENIHLRFGQEYHTSLEQYDIFRTDGASHEDALRQMVSELLLRTYGWEVDTDTKAGKYKNRESLLRAVIDYVDNFQRDAAQTLVLENGEPAVELSFRFELDWGPDSADEEKDITRRQPYLLCGHLDRVVNYQDHLYVMDRKTTTYTLSPTWFKQFDVNNQMTLYTLASQVILQAPIKGVIIDGAQLLLTEPVRFQRGFTYRTPDQLEEWTRGLQDWFAMAEAYALNNYWPMNDTSCDKFGGCRFREICSKSPQVREKFLASHFVKQPLEERWNPLKPR